MFAEIPQEAAVLEALRKKVTILIKLSLEKQTWFKEKIKKKYFICNK